MSSVPIRIKQLGIKESKRPTTDDNAGFATKKSTAHLGEDWGGKTKGKTKHTYKNED